MKGRRPVGPPRKSEETHNKCIFCATTHEMRKESCPARSKTCSSCKGRNHFADCCRKKACHPESEYELLNVVTSINNVQSERSPTSTKPFIFAHMRINDETVKFQVDCGASVNLIIINSLHRQCGTLAPHKDSPDVGPNALGTRR